LRLQGFLTLREIMETLGSVSAVKSRLPCTKELVCRGVMPNGMLRHPLFVRWLV